MKLDEKLGPLKLWQWLGVGGVAGLAYYLYHKKSVATPEGEGATLAGSVPTNLPGGFGGESIPAPAAPGEPGIPGPPGSPGEPGAVGPPAPPLDEARLDALESAIAGLNSAPVANRPAPMAKRKPKAKQHKRKPAQHHKEAHHQAARHGRLHAHPPKATHHPHTHQRVAHIQHGRPIPLKHRVHHKHKHK